MDLKLNINKLHYLLSEKFNNVQIKEESSKDLGNYIRISINENMLCDIIMTKKELEKTNINWKYDSNPLNEKSTWVERNCDIESFTDVVEEIFKKKRFDSEYLKKIN
jgi:hypothetical protein